MMLSAKHLLAMLLSTTLLAACSSVREPTLLDLSKRNLEYTPASVSIPGRQDAVDSYRAFLAQSSGSQHYSDALRRLADLELEIGEQIHSQDDPKPGLDGKSIMLSSIEHYRSYLSSYPDSPSNDLIMYQLAKAYSLTGESENALEMMNAIVTDHPKTRHIDEIQFRRGEILFSFGEYGEAEKAYHSIVADYGDSIYFEKALYKLGWAQFKQAHYPIALETFFSLLDRKHAEGKIMADELNPGISTSEQDFINDVLRVVSYSLSYNDGTDSIASILSRHNQRLYIPIVYKRLGELYLSKERHSDAARVFMSYPQALPTSPLAPDFHNLAIEAYQLGRFNEETLTAKKSFTLSYGVTSSFWNYQAEDNRHKINTQLKRHIHDLANYYHATARKTRALYAYMEAAAWYQLYIDSFPMDTETPAMNFLLAEAYFDANNYHRALTEYEKTAYHYSLHEHSAEAGYAALISYDKLMTHSQPAELTILKSRHIQSAIKFCNQFSQHKHHTAVTVKTAEDLFETQNYPLAADFARRIIDRTDITDKNHKQTAWIVLAHSRFELKDYKASEQAYTAALKLTDKSQPLYKELAERLAASLYKQAEQHRDRQEYELAALGFLSIGKILPTSSIRATADYDAASIYINTKQWDKATPILESFRINFPNSVKFATGVSQKLALAYTESGQYAKAASEISYLAGVSTSPAEKQSLTWQAAEMHDKSGDKHKANALYINYINHYPQPFTQYIEAHYRVSEFYRTSKDTTNWTKWLNKTVKTEKTGGNARTDRTGFIAANALIHLVKPVIRQFETTRLTHPLKKSLARKKTLMENALSAYKDIMSYQIAEFTTESTYRVAEIYHQMATSLMDSQRPKGLSDDELEQYDILLEEQAYPFEEKAIDIHTSNIKRTRDGIYDDWVKKSMEILANIQPVRYQKKEKIETYALFVH